MFASRTIYSQPDMYPENVRAKSINATVYGFKLPGASVCLVERGDWKWAEEITSAAEEPMDHVCVSLQDR